MIPEKVQEHIAGLREIFSKTIKAPKRLTVSEWSDEFRRLPPSGSAEPGRWRTDRFPFLREIMDCLSPHDPCKEVVVMKGSQVGMTETALNFILYTIDHNPAPILYVQNTVEDVEKFSKQRLQRSISLIPSVNEKIGEQKSRDSSNTIRIKNFPGGILLLGGANSASSLRSMPIMILILDEEEGYDADLDDEGSPTELAKRRTSNFPRRKVFRLSTPLIRETSAIEPGFMNGDQRYYYVECPGCKEKNPLFWAAMKWENEDPETVCWACPACGELIPERHKNQMLARGEWRKHNPDGRYPSFHISALYSPMGFFSWVEAADMFITASRTFNKEKLKVFVNTVLGETWTETGKEIEAHWVAKRKEEYTHAAPDGVLIVTAGVDVQEDRIECEVVGWGHDLENWSLDYVAFMGDTERSDVWDDLDNFLRRGYLHPKGLKILPACVAIDSGHRARVVYTFCRRREFRRFFPVKGFDGFGKGYIKRPMHRNQDGVWLFQVFVDEIKSKIYSQLQISEPGPGFCHFPDKEKYNSDYFKMLTAERLESVKRGGRAVLRWTLPRGRRNEALDCRTYATAALNILNPNFDALAAAGVPTTMSGRTVRKRGRVLSKGE